MSRRNRGIAGRRQASRLSVEQLESRTLLSASGTDQGSNYAQLHRDIVLRADIYGGARSTPRILAAGYGFEGIQGIPGLLVRTRSRSRSRPGPASSGNWWGSIRLHPSGTSRPEPRPSAFRAGASATTR